MGKLCRIIENKNRIAFPTCNIITLQKLYFFFWRKHEMQFLEWYYTSLKNHEKKSWIILYVFNEKGRQRQKLKMNKTGETENSRFKVT